MSEEAIRCETTAPRLPVIFGELVRIDIVCTDLTDGTAVDPDQLLYLAKKPDGEEPTPLSYGVSPLIIRKEAGVYYIDMGMDQSGVYTYRWQVQGKTVGVAEGQVTVKASAVVTG